MMYDFANMTGNALIENGCQTHGIFIYRGVLKTRKHGWTVVHHENMTEFKNKYWSFQFYNTVTPLEYAVRIYSIEFSQYDEQFNSVLFPLEFLR